MNVKAGILYGIGVGPGDPDLITIKAAKILNRVDIVFAAASTKNDHSLAVNIAREHIPDRARVKKLRFPMTRDKNETRRAWKEHALTIIAELEKGQNVAFLTLGDSMTYSTYGYILKYVQTLAPHLEAQTVPGITSYQAAAARLNTPLVEGEESLMIVSGAKGGNRLRELCGKPENVVPKIVEGKMNKFFKDNCLLNQPYVRDPDLSVEDLLNELIAKIGENISIRRFVRFQTGEGQG